MDDYDFEKIETHWQEAWAQKGTLDVQETPDKPKTYVLDMFPGPSGPLHMGHAKNYVIGDVMARYCIRQGDNVFHPVGWDAFGLPAEIAAIKHGVHPRQWTDKHIAIQSRQFRSLGIHHDWSAEINTSDPTYYRWNQWLFLKLYEHGLAYRAERPTTYCPQCQTTLANEEIVDGQCERCDTPIVEKPLQQWFLKITAYADALLKGLDNLPNWPERIKTMQRQWIGRSTHSNGETTYHLRDWCISRQRYWGTPIPIVHCPNCGTVPVPETDLPVRLPDIKSFKPDGQSPLSRVPEFVNTTCPHCGKPAQRECDTMTGFVCSSWYFLRFLSPQHQDHIVDPGAVKNGMPIAHYIGGKEHGVGHLMYARFITHFLHNLGLVPFTEPFTHLFNQGVVYKDGSKMSKSRGNVVSIEHMTSQYGADTARMFVLFATSADRDMEWNDEGVAGIHRFLNRIWRIISQTENTHQTPPNTLNRTMHKTIHTVTQDMERFQYNTAISRIMELANAIQEVQIHDDGNTFRACKTLVALLAPFAPHIAESLWQKLGQPFSIHETPWPKYDPTQITEEIVEVSIQINGKMRDTIQVSPFSNATDIINAAQQSKRVVSFLNNHQIQRTIYVPNRLVNFVTEMENRKSKVKNQNPVTCAPSPRRSP